MSQQDVLKLRAEPLTWQQINAGIDCYFTFYSDAGYSCNFGLLDGILYQESNCPGGYQQLPFETDGTIKFDNGLKKGYSTPDT